MGIIAHIAIREGGATMFEKEAKEYVIKKHNVDMSKQSVDFSLRCEFAEDFTDFQKGAEFGYAVRLLEIKDASDKRLEPILKKLLDLKVIKGWYFNGTYHGE